jgi:hypothetical protein
MTGAVDPEVRAAQRRIVSTINASGKLNGNDGIDEMERLAAHAGNPS